MDNMETIEQLCALLKGACCIIEEQASILAQHGITTEAGTLERRRAELLQHQSTFEEGAVSLGRNDRII